SSAKLQERSHRLRRRLLSMCALCRGTSSFDRLFGLFDLIQGLNRLNSLALNRALDPECLRIAPVVEGRNLMNTRYRAVVSASLLCQVLTPDVFHGIAFERNCRVASLLRAIVDEPVFANVEVT